VTAAWTIRQKDFVSYPASKIINRFLALLCLSKKLVEAERVFFLRFTFKRNWAIPSVLRCITVHPLEILGSKGL
jgi:hypothetical protein